jgi:hypothetical protein
MALEEIKILFKPPIEAAGQNGVNVHIIFIPSKESVFYTYLKENGHPVSDSIAALFKSEDELARHLACYFNSLNVRTLYLRDALLQEVRRGRKVYPSSRDDHPTACGYSVYAAAACQLLQKR